MWEGERVRRGEGYGKGQGVVGRYTQQLNGDCCSVGHIESVCTVQYSTCCLSRIVRSSQEPQHNQHTDLHFTNKKIFRLITLQVTNEPYGQTIILVNGCNLYGENALGLYSGGGFVFFPPSLVVRGERSSLHTSLGGGRKEGREWYNAIV